MDSGKPPDIFIPFFLSVATLIIFFLFTTICLIGLGELVAEPGFLWPSRHKL